MKIFNKNEWKKVKLGDVCDLRNGVAIKSEDYVTTSNTLNCRMSNIRPDGTFDILYNAKYLPDNFLEKYKNYLLKDGDLVIAMTDMAGDPKILGVPTVVKSNGFNIIQNQRVGKLELLTKNIDENYLKLVLQSKKAKNYFKKFSAGGVQLNLSKKEILNAPIVLPTIEEQKILVNLFKTIESFIYLRKKGLLNLNLLNKSLFISMFFSGNKNFERKKLKENVTEMFIGPFGSDLKNEVFVEKERGYCVVYEQKHAIKKRIDDEIRYITKEKYEVLKRFRVDAGDIIVSCRGTIGKIFALPSNSNFGIIHPSLMKIKLKKEKYNNTFFEKLLEKYMQENLYSIQGSSIKMAITAKKLGEEYFIIPPIELQNEFSNRIEKIEKLSFEIEEAIKEAENLYNSLIFKYFD